LSQKLNIAICSYRSAPFGGGQGIFVFELSRALNDLGHQVDVISGPPYPNLANNIKLIQSPGLDLFRTFNFKERLKIFLKKKIRPQTIGMNLFQRYLEGFQN
jgi:glycosyltransferase involved in cell wall biosynthesis